MTTPNTAPVFPLTPNVSGVAVGGTANTNSDGSGTIGTNIFVAYKAGAQGSFVNRIRLSLYGTSAAAGSAATVHRIYVSSASSGSTTAANTWLIGEIQVPVLSADQSTVANYPFDLALDFALPAGYTILVSTHIVNNSTTGWMAVVNGGDY